MTLSLVRESQHAPHLLHTRQSGMAMRVLLLPSRACLLSRQPLTSGRSCRQPVRDIAGSQRGTVAAASAGQWRQPARDSGVSQRGTVAAGWPVRDSGGGTVAAGWPVREGGDAVLGNSLESLLSSRWPARRRFAYPSPPVSHCNQDEEKVQKREVAGVQ